MRNRRPLFSSGNDALAVTVTRSCPETALRREPDQREAELWCCDRPGEDGTLGLLPPALPYLFEGCRGPAQAGDPVAVAVTNRQRIAASYTAVCVIASARDATGVLTPVARMASSVSWFHSRTTVAEQQGPILQLLDPERMLFQDHGDISFGPQ